MSTFVGSLIRRSFSALSVHCHTHSPFTAPYTQVRHSHWIGGYMNGWHAHHIGKSDAKRIGRYQHRRASKRRTWKRNQRPGASRMMKGG